MYEKSRCYINSIILTSKKKLLTPEYVFINR